MENVRKLLLRTAERIKARRLEDLSARLGVSRQAVHQRALYHNIYDELKIIFSENRPLWTKAPKDPGILILKKGSETIYWYSRTNLKVLIKSLYNDFKNYQISYYSVLESRSDVIIECLRKRFKDPQSRLLYEDKKSFPYISYRTDAKSYRIYAPGSQKYIGSAQNFKAAIDVLKRYVLSGETVERKEIFINRVNEKKLYKMYVTDKQNLQQVADRFGVSMSTVYLALKKFKIPINKIGRPVNDKM